MNTFDKIYFIRWTNGKIEAIENLSYKMKNSFHPSYGYPTPFHFMQRYNAEEQKWETGTVLDSNFNRIDNEQIISEWLSHIDHEVKKRLTIKRRRHSWCNKDDGRRHRRAIKTFNERKQCFALKDEIEGYIEPEVRGRRRNVPCDRSARRSQSKTLSWKCNRKTQYK